MSSEIRHVVDEMQKARTELEAEAERFGSLVAQLELAWRVPADHREDAEARGECLKGLQDAAEGYRRHAGHLTEAIRLYRAEGEQMGLLTEELKNAWK